MENILDLFSEGMDILDDYHYQVDKASKIYNTLKSIDLSEKDKERVLEETGIDVDGLLDDLEVIIW